MGPATFGGELASGLQLTTYTATDVPNYVEPWVQSWFVLEAHTNIDLWLTSRLTVSVESASICCTTIAPRSGCCSECIWCRSMVYADVGEDKPVDAAVRSGEGSLVLEEPKRLTEGVQGV